MLALNPDECHSVFFSAFPVFVAPFPPCRHSFCSHSGVLALNFVTVADRNMNGLDFGSVLHRHTVARTLVIQNTGSVPVGFTAKVRSPFYTVRSLSSAGIKLLPSGTYTVVNTHEDPVDQPR